MKPQVQRGRIGAAVLAVVVIACSLCAIAALMAGSALAADVPSARPAKPRSIPIANKASKDDLDGMIRRRMIRILVPYSRTLFFNDKGRERGLTADLARDFERYVNQRFRKQLGGRPITVYIAPTTREHLFEQVAAGYGDIAAGNLTVTDEREKLVDFYVAPHQIEIREIALTGAAAPALASVDDLSGRTVHVRRSSSYHESLVALNERFAHEGKAPAKLVLVPEPLEDEDMMEMLDAGVFQTIVVDDWKARMWSQVLPRIRLNPEAALRVGANTGWAMRKESPQLMALVSEWFPNALAMRGFRTDRSMGYAGRVRQLYDPTGAEDYKRFVATIELFRKYGERYGFDPLMLAAQGYQESQLNQAARSPTGAIGIMQVLPSTGRDLRVGDIRIAEHNIHAGAKYMDVLMTRYFPDARFDELNRSMFAFASYNAGPGGIERMRREAAKRGLDPDRWFDNVEVVTAQLIGMETTTYVRNIFKYYVSYKLLHDIEEMKRKAIESVKPGG